MHFDNFDNKKKILIIDNIYYAHIDYSTREKNI